MWFEQILFFVAGIAALGGAVGVVTLQNQFYSVLSLIAHLLGLAVLFLLLVAAVGAVVMARKRRGVYGHDQGAKGAITVRDPMMEGADEPGRGARGGPAGRAY